MVDLVVFDVGGVLVDETRMWRACADTLDVSFERFMAELRAVIAERRHHREVFRRLAGDDAERLRKSVSYKIEPADLYADARLAIAALREHGFRVAVAANQPVETEAALAQARLPFDFILASDRLGVAKPDPAFFDAIARACGLPPDRIAYVGDRIDNDVLPAGAAGMVPVFIPRGPWGEIHATWPQVKEARFVVESLTEIAALLAETPQPW